MTVSAATAAGVSAVSAVSAVSTLLADERIPDPDSVTPGIVGFIVTFGIALVTLLLVIDMVRRVRRVNLRAQVREELEAEIAARDAAAAEEESGTSDRTAAGTDPEAGPPTR